MAARNIFYGTLNKAIVAIRFPDNPLLNITSDMLDESMVQVSYQGNISEPIMTATGIVMSPNTVQQVQVSFKLVKTLPIAQQFADAVKKDARLGDVEVAPDAKNLERLSFSNGIIMSRDAITFSGKDAGAGYTITCYEPINNDIFG